MLSLTDQQLQTVLNAAKAIEPGEKRDIFLRRVAMMMKFRPRIDQDLADAVQLALCGLTPRPTDTHAARSSAA